MKMNKLWSIFLMFVITFGNASIFSSCGNDDEDDNDLNTDIIGNENGYEYVDLGLSVKWATCNVGATKPEDYGEYYAWGELEPKSIYEYKNYVDRRYEKYCNSTKTILEIEDDVAHVKWGGKWRIPTTSEFMELISSKCTHIWTTENGVNGYLFTSNINGRSIFIPAAGRFYGSNLKSVGSQGNYWANGIRDDDSSRTFEFESDWIEPGAEQRYYGLTVRPVCE